MRKGNKNVYIVWKFLALCSDFFQCVNMLKDFCVLILKYVHGRFFFPLGNRFLHMAPDLMQLMLRAMLFLHRHFDVPDEFYIFFTIIKRRKVFDRKEENM